MDNAQLLAVFDHPISRQLLNSGIPARLAYTARDGSPRVIPIGSWWTGEALVMATTPNAPKVAALAADPRVAITIDTEGFPPHVLLIRGEARLETVDGVPEEYLLGARKVVPAEQWDDWEASVRGLYEQMVRISVRPTWAKLLDFETTLPSPVEELLRARQEG